MINAFHPLRLEGFGTGEVARAAATQHKPFQIAHDVSGLSPAALQHPSISQDDAAFTAFLLNNEHERAASISALLARLSGTAVRVLQVSNPLRSPLTLERILIQVAGTKHELFLEDDAFLIVQAITERQEAETRVILLIDRAQTLHPMVLHSLQAMAPYFIQKGRPLLQVVFVGHPTFLALLSDEALAPLRTALGLQADLYVSEDLEVETSRLQGAAPTPTPVGASSVQFPKRSGGGCIDGQVVPAPKLAAMRLMRALTLAAVELEASPKAILPKPIPPKTTDGEAGDFQPGPTGPETSLIKSGATLPAETSRPVSPRRRDLVRLTLVLAISTGLVGSAYLSLHELLH